MTVTDHPGARPDAQAADVAVVGMAGRFPGAENLDAYWRNLREGVESIRTLSDAELLAEGVPEELFSRPGYVRAASVLTGIDQFDAGFFNLSAREAALLDPQQRLFLETVWHALEDAGRGPGTDADVGVFAGAGMSAYLMSNLLGGRRIVTSPSMFELQIHNDKDYLATRTAFLLGLTGPAVTVQTACSSSLVAVHQAVRSLLAGDCGTAVAGGVCVRVPHHVGYLYEEGLIYSPDGHCRPFDADARGTVFGSGVGAVVLRRLSDALADGDNVLAVIRSIAVNNDGSDKVGYTAPSASGQERLVARALDAAAIDPRTVTAIEAHGTGTPAGDPIEINALTRALARHTADTGFCALGSVKANIGHLESAAGVASLIKAVLQLRHRELTPDPHFQRPNPRIDFDRTPFYVNTELTAWTNGTHPRRIGVSSFGIGGTNAHAVLEEAPARVEPAEPVLPQRPQILVLSAKSPKALDQATAELAAQLAATAEAVGTAAAGTETTTAAHRLEAVAATSQLGRTSLRFRRALVAGDLGTAAGLLAGAAPDRVSSAVAPLAPPAVVFLFPGQGTQYPGMGRGLYDQEPVFRAAVDACAEILAPHLAVDLREELYPDSADARAAGPRDLRLAQTALAQPALFATEYALARLLESWGVRPAAMIGHSLGEFVAAVLAGVADLADVLRLVALRGQLMQTLPPGGMIAVGASEDDLTGLLPPELSVAAVNAPGLCVVSGPHEALARLRERLADRDISTRPLHTSHAFHSSMVDPIVPAFTEEIRSLDLREPEHRIRSTVTTGWLGGRDARDPEYWGGHMRRPVRFGAAVRDTAAELGPCVFLEVGPGNTLGTLARQAAEPATVTAVLGGMRRPDQDAPDLEVLLGSLAGLWLAGVAVDWSRSQPNRPNRPNRPKATLPGYPFQRRRYWVEPATPGSDTILAVPDGIVGEAETTADPGGETDTSSGRPEHLMTTYTAPRDQTEHALAGLWEEFFGFAPVGVHDNFFELGGHSLMATQILNRLRSELGRTATPSQLLAQPTVAGLARLLAEGGGTDDLEPELPQLTPAPALRHEPFPLNEMQQAQWIGRLGSFDMGGVAPHLYLEFDSDTLDPARLERAWWGVIGQHEMLRMVVLPDGRQRVLADVPRYQFAELDLRGLTTERAGALLAEVSDRMAADVRPADTWPLWEIRVSRLDDRTIRTHVSFDLLCADVASFFYQVLPAWRDHYQALGQGAPALAEPAGTSFRDYVLAEESLRQTPLYERSLQYWQRRIRELPPAPELPTVMAPGELARPTFVRRHATLDADTWAAIKERAGEHGVTPSSVLLAAYAAALGRWSTHQHFTLNFTAVNRLPFHPDVIDMVGEFASFELLEVDLRGVDTFADLVTQVQRRSWEDFEHRYVSGVRIMRELNRLRGQASGGAMPVVFTSALSTETDPASVPSPVAWLGEQVGFISQTPQVTIDHFVLEFGGRLELAWHAVDELFPPDLMAEIFTAYQELLAGLATARGWQGPPLAALPTWQLDARTRANDTGGPAPSGLLPTRVLNAGLDPSYAALPAVITTERALPHAELAGRAVEVARLLAAHGLGRGALVGVGLAKGWRQVVAAVGASAAGCTYVPIDPGLPAARRQWLVEHAGIDCVLVEAGDDRQWPDAVSLLVVPDGKDWDPRAVAGWRCPAEPEDLAYIIYTSGSTGTPKGVAVTHAAALNTLDDVVERFAVTHRDRVLGLSSLSFDLSVFDIFGVLGTGAALVLPDAEARRDPAHWATLVHKHAVSVWNTVPALLDMLVTYVESTAQPQPLSPPARSLPLRLALLSGDWIPVSLPDRARELSPGLSVVSLGGATEAAVWSIAFPVGAVPPTWTSIPYGYPLRNQTFHVLNDRMEPAPVWTAGQLHIGGAGLAACYWNDERRTAESFVFRPGTSERLYRTGDLGRYLPDGSIEFLGREDFQVKIGGFRVELGEVEHAIAQHDGVQAVVAAALGERAQRRLVAYLVPRPDNGVRLDADALAASVRRHLADTVPAYLVPADLVVLDRLPLSDNGKVDRAALPAPERVGRTADDPDDHHSETIRLLTALASEILSVETVGASNNFFALGGDSIMGIQLVGQATARGLRMRPQDLFESETFLDLAVRLDQLPEAGPEATLVPLTEHQRVLAAAGTVNRLVVDLVDGTDATAVEQAVLELVRRHDALRLALRSRTDTDGTDVSGQYDADPPQDSLFSRIDLRGLASEAQEGALAEIAAEMAAEIDPRAGVTVKVAQVLTGGRERLLWLAAATAADDASWRLLLADFAHAHQQLADGAPIRWETPAGSFLGWAAGRPDGPVTGTDMSTAGAGGPGSAGAGPRPWSPGSRRTVLTAETTDRLRAAALRAYRLDLGEAVALAVALAVARAGSSDGRPSLSVERSDRPAALAAAAGRFTRLVTVAVPPPDALLGDVVSTVKRQLRQGSSPPPPGWMLHMRELSDGEWQPPSGPLVLDAVAGPTEVLHLPGSTATAGSGPLDEVRDETAAPGEVGARGEVGAVVVAGALWLTWRHTAEAAAAVAAVAEAFPAAVETVIEHCADGEVGDYDPSDFPLAAIGPDELADFLSTLE
ncbi:non-ribosomal peptide synthetase/type I polyketide synthase [Parafrankia sp. FMc2]|uniref:non-ribosomal peptide synthetase/type I polyketide synthase n=1 Tax=Parafrankia sp. FMc2 TaxID=3233196 RepID=UPI0034D61073